MRPVTTKGQRRIGRTIRKLEASVELSDKECFAKKDEALYRQKAKAQSASDDSPVQSLRYLVNLKKDATTP
jgi:hypothetical protein